MDFSSGSPQGKGQLIKDFLIDRELCFYGYIFIAKYDSWGQKKKKKPVYHKPWTFPKYFFFPELAVFLNMKEKTTHDTNLEKSFQVI